MKRFLKYFLAISAVFILSGCGSDDEAKTIVKNTKSFTELKKEIDKDYNLKTVDGKVININLENDLLTSKTIGNKFVLVNFWATWCPPCIKEIPTFNKIYEKYKDKFEIVAVLYEKDKSVEELKQFIQKYDMRFPVVIGDENFRMAKYFNDVKKVPESYLYGSDGKYIKSYIGEVDAKDLEAILNK